MKNLLFLVILTFISLQHYGQFWKLENRNHNVNKYLNEIQQDQDFKNAGFAFLAKDLNTGEVIAQHQPDRAFKPASTQKLFSTATALELFGPNYQFETKIGYSGIIDTSTNTLQGDIIIKGGGDPTLGSKYFDTAGTYAFLEEWANAIQSLGIDSIAGGIIADARVYSWDIVPTTWSWQDLGNYYGAGPCGLTIFDNYYTIHFNSGKIAGDTTKIAQIQPEVPGIYFDNAVTGDSIHYDNAYIFGSPYTGFRYLRGEIPLNRNHFKVKGSLPDPAYLAACELHNTIKKRGTKVRDEATTIRQMYLDKQKPDTSFTLLTSTFSPELSKVIAETNIHSINLYAEHCLSHSGIRLQNVNDTYQATEAVETFWEDNGMDIQGLSLHDGSGLSHYNLITPNQMVFLLEHMKNESSYSEAFYNSMAIAGETGTLKRMFKGSIAEGKLRAKSGTINRVKAYAGYVTSKSGRDIGFSMVFNNFSCSSGKARSTLENLMIELAKFDK